MQKSDWQSLPYKEYGMPQWSSCNRAYTITKSSQSKQGQLIPNLLSVFYRFNIMYFGVVSDK